MIHRHPMNLNRRKFVQTSAGAALGAALSYPSLPLFAAGAKKYFSLAQRAGRWWFVGPDAKPCFSLGLNHVDSSPLRYPEAGDAWQRKYRNSTERWLKEAVRRDMLEWGFNSLGWSQEVVIRGQTIHRHSPSFTFEEYQWLDLPYCHLLPFSETHQWDAEVRHPDFFSKDFEEWCDYVCRSQCARFARDPKLIGYFYSDCPLWVHTRPPNAWKGPLFDPGKLKSDSGRSEFNRLATRYYQVIHDAIRRYDPNHLILGDRYEVNAPLPEEVLLAARPYVDVFSFQHFGAPGEIREALGRFATLTGKPVLLADSAGQTPLPDGARRNDPERYRATMAALREIPACVGFHLCGAYLRNRARNRGLRGPDETPDHVAIAGITAANREMEGWRRGLTEKSKG
jgi:hypothetical protein